MDSFLGVLRSSGQACHGRHWDEFEFWFGRLLSIFIRIGIAETSKVMAKSKKKFFVSRDVALLRGFVILSPLS
jgi:hypothetical protein